MAEYDACVMGLEEAIDLMIKYLDVYGDSALVVNQIKGEWETNQPGLIPYRDYERRIKISSQRLSFIISLEMKIGWQMLLQHWLQ